MEKFACIWAGEDVPGSWPISLLVFYGRKKLRVRGDLIPQVECNYSHHIERNRKPGKAKAQLEWADTEPEALESVISPHP